MPVYKPQPQSNVSASSLLSGAKVFEKGNYMPPGAHCSARITGMKLVQSQDPQRRGSIFSVVEFIVEHVAEPGVQVGGGPAPVAVDQARTWICDISSPSGAGNTKGFLQEFYQRPLVDGDKESDKLIDEAFSVAQPLNGALFELQTHHIKTRTGGDFTVHNWRFVAKE